MTSRRSFLQSAGLTTAAALCCGASQPTDPLQPLQEFDYGAIELAPGLPRSQFEQTQQVLLFLNEDSLLKPWRTRAGLPAPGAEMGGWYDAVPEVSLQPHGHGFATGIASANGYQRCPAPTLSTAIRKPAPKSSVCSPSTNLPSRESFTPTSAFPLTCSTRW